MGSIKNIRFNNIIARSEAGILVYGEKSGIIQDLVFDDVQLEIKSGEHGETYGGNFDLRPVADLKDAIFVHDIPGLFAQNVNGLDIRRFKLVWNVTEKFYSHGISLYSINGGEISDFTGTKVPKSKKAKSIHMQDCTNIFVDENE